MDQGVMAGRASFSCHSCRNVVEEVRQIPGEDRGLCWVLRMQQHLELRVPTASVPFFHC